MSGLQCLFFIGTTGGTIHPVRRLHSGARRRAFIANKIETRTNHIGHRGKKDSTLVAKYTSYS